MRTIIFSFTFALLSFAQTPNLIGIHKFRFYSPTASEYTLSFNFKVELIKQSQPTETEIKTAIDKQVGFLFGSFSNQYRTGVPKADHEVVVTGLSQNRGAWVANYQYRGTVLVSSGPTTYSFYLPLNPYTIWTLATSNTTSRYACGDEHYPYEKYFWYFFNPKAYGCPLVENKDYIQVTGQLSLSNNTKQTFPEYERLFVNQEMTVHILFGMDNSSLDWNPNSSKDLSAVSYRQLKSVLSKWGYQGRAWTPSEIQQFFGQTGYQTPSVEEFSKNTSKGTIRYRLFFGSSTIPDGIGFFKFLNLSIRSSSVMIYAGHSGLGEYLNLDLIQNYAQFKIETDKNRYQIYFFNSCSSYPYYNSQYFNLKKSASDPKGTKNLDIITNGLATLFSSIAPSIASVMYALETYAVQSKKTSYQDIINNANSDNLIGINGDEDNQVR